MTIFALSLTLVLLNNMKNLILLLCAITCANATYLGTDAEIVAATIILEAGGEYAPNALKAVNEVIQNRAVKRRMMPSQVCLQRLQFSCWNNIDKRPQLFVKAKSHPRFSQALKIAMSAPTNYTKGADHYHANYCMPYWAKSMTVTVVIGRHIFYK